MPRIFLKIRENHGRPIAVRGSPILNPNRGRVFPISGIVSSPPPDALNFALNLINPQPRLANKNGAILETHWSPMIFLKIRENRGQPITVWGAPILNPNHGRVFPILGIVHSPPPEALNFALNLIIPQPRLAGKNGAILDAHWLPMIFLKIRGNHRRPIAV